MGVAERFEAMVMFEPNTGCWLWTGALLKSGYGAFRLNGKTMRAHRVSWSIYRGRIDDSASAVLHRCDTPACVNPRHLFLGTTTDNMRDMWRKGRGVVPRLSNERHPQAKLTMADAAHIRAERQSGRRQVDLARAYCVNRSTIADICGGLRWVQ